MSCIDMLTLKFMWILSRNVGVEVGWGRVGLGRWVGDVGVVVVGGGALWYNST